MFNFTVEQIKEIENADSLQTARVLLNTIIENSSTGQRPIKPSKRQYLLNQVQGTRKILDVAAIAYNMLLAGEGLNVIGSKYFSKI